MRPVWSDATLGAVLVDGEAGSVVCAAVSPDGPAARAGLLPGDRVVAIAGRAAISAAVAKSTVVDAGARATLVLDVAPPSGSARKIECVTSAVPQIAPPSGNDASNVVRAAWASVDAAAGGSEAAIALANLASLLDRSGRDAAALTAWRRVRSIGDGVLAARAAYSVGAALQADGKSAEAIEAFDQARSVGLALGDLALAAAAIDRLADLGVAPR
jgi:tetratricopeptide (TPR) repeat protein